MTVRLGESAVLFFCHAGCTSADIIEALRTGDFSPPAGHDPGKRRKGGADLNKLAVSIWRYAAPIAGTLAETYLRTRAIVPEGVTARFDARCQFGAGEAKAYAPALIVPIEDDSGVIAIHRTFLRPDGRGKADIEQPKRMLGNPGGGAVRWGGIPADHILRLAEGVEDAASVMNMLAPGTFVWPALGIERYQGITIPDSVLQVIIYSQHGREAARTIARATPHLTANDRQLLVKKPPNAGDWNDLVQEIRAQ